MIWTRVIAPIFYNTNHLLYDFGAVKWKSTVSSQTWTQDSNYIQIYMFKYVYRLVGWVLWYVNLCRLFNTKSIFMKIVPFQTIQFKISTQFKYFYFKLFSLVKQL